MIFDTRPAVDRDQLRVLRALRMWLGPDQVEVLAVLEQEGAGEGNPPRLTGHQLALGLDDPERSTAPLSRAEAAGRQVGAALDR